MQPFYLLAAKARNLKHLNQARRDRLAELGIIFQLARSIKCLDLINQRGADPFDSVQSLLSNHIAEILFHHLQHPRAT